MSKTNPQIETAQFIPASAAFKGLQRLWTEFTESNPPFVWGENNRTFVTAAALLNHLDNRADVTPRFVESLRTRLRRLSSDLQLYIDLEN